MKTIYICEGEPLTGKTFLAGFLNSDVVVIDNYYPTTENNVELAHRIDSHDNRNDYRDVYFIICHESYNLIEDLMKHIRLQEYQIFNLISEAKGSINIRKHLGE